MAGFFSTFFVNAPLLLGAIGAAIPFILHMVYRRRAPRVRFSTLRFIRAATERTARRRRIREWVLLLLRAAAVFLLAMGLAGPIFHSADLGSSEVSVAIVLDNSYSMAAEREGISQYARARDHAVRLLSSLSAESQAAVLFACPLPADAGMGELLTTDHNGLADAISRSEISAMSGDLTAAIVRAEALLAEAPADQREVYIFSDLQQAAWRTLPEPAEARTPTMVIIDCSTDAHENVALTDLSFAAGRPAVRVPMTLRARFKNFGNQPRQGKAVLYKDRTNFAERAVMIDANAEAEIRFSLSFETPGPHAGWVELQDVNDILPADNRRYFALDVIERIRVGIVREKQGAAPLLDEAFYILPALNPGVGADSPIAPETMLRSELTRKSLASYRVLYLLNLPELSAAEQRAVADYLHGGGAVVIFPGDLTRPAAWNALTDSESSPLRNLIPARLGALLPESDAPDTVITLDENVEFGHRVFALFREMERSFFTTVVVSRYFDLLVDDTSGATVLARLSNGRPFLVEKHAREGGGGVLLFCTSATTRWSNLPTCHLYLSLLHQITYALARMHDVEGSIAPGQPVYFRGPQAARNSADKDMQITVSDPRGVVEAVALEPSSDGVLSPVYRHTSRTGIFTWSHPGDDGGRGAFAVNLDTAESDLTALSQEQIAVQMLNSRKAHFVRNAGEALAVAARLRQGLRLRTPLLFFVVGLLVFECILANQGRAPKPRQKLRVTGAGASM